MPTKEQYRTMAEECRAEAQLVAYVAGSQGRPNPVHTDKMGPGDMLDRAERFDALAGKAKE
jgi:hypothetical protein